MAGRGKRAPVRPPGLESLWLVRCTLYAGRRTHLFWALGQLWGWWARTPSNFLLVLTLLGWCDSSPHSYRCTLIAMSVPCGGCVAIRSHPPPKRACRKLTACVGLLPLHDTVGMSGWCG